MSTNLKRFTISITPSMEADLDILKKERYYKVTRNEMIRDLIILGLKSLKAEKPKNQKSS
ncbi:MAG: ribbon-helix-helix domain-containing protein [Lachnospiraceae bacterium]|nr:ribbon-helix-helix domain-containing protein [Lachnospiraceae bacterium]MDE6252595.1 ribbon-helix-helix domain-containing protein [Lachnospiraceae bacterium]